ncbi:MAG: hypothetical protein R2709_12670 [Marmoricola sp.]
MATNLFVALVMQCWAATSKSSSPPTASVCVSKSKTDSIDLVRDSGADAPPSKCPRKSAGGDVAGATHGDRALRRTHSPGGSSVTQYVDFTWWGVFGVHAGDEYDAGAAPRKSSAAAAQVAGGVGVVISQELQLELIGRDDVGCRDEDVLDRRCRVWGGVQAATRGTDHRVEAVADLGIGRPSRCNRVAHHLGDRGTTEIATEHCVEPGE